MEQKASQRRGLFARVGPGVISGVANDDPSCIVTYSMAGAAFGYLTLWTSLFSLPLLAAVQLMCSRLGMVSGRGLAGEVRANHPRWALLSISALLVLANVVTIGADLAGMAAVTEMVTGAPALLWTGVYAVGIVALLFYFPYRQIEKVFRWLCLVLFAYLVAGFLARPDWPAALTSTVLPRFEWSSRYLSVMVAIVGATMSPYFLFWQVSQQVEQEYAMGRRTVAARRGASRHEIEDSRVDVLAGSFVCKLITYFITLTAAATLFAQGRHEIRTAEEAAAALEPVAGPAAFWLFALGVISTGILAVPVLASSSAYAVSEALRWKATLEEKPAMAPKFYGVLTVSLLVGTGLIYLGLNAVEMLFWASVLNGLLVPPSLLLVVLLTRNPKVMGQHVNPPWMTALGWLTILLTGAMAAAVVVSLIA
jgi:NRAMP (natural resistance-associated macrophage protein)-like metal ion transporter